MFDVLRARLRAQVAKLAARAKKALREALRPRPSLVGGLLVNLTRSRSELLEENALLRQQLVVLARGAEQPKARPLERALVVLLASALPHWRNVLLLWKPETILRWHRHGFRLFSRFASSTKTRRTPRIPKSTIDLIQRFARGNRLLGAERIRGELLKLGIQVAKRTVQRHISCARTSPSPRSQNWHTFLRNHTVWACDFLQVYDVWFRPLFAFFISARRECLDHVVVLGETHLRSVLVAYGKYFNTARPHQSLGQATPVPVVSRNSLRLFTRLDGGRS